MEKIVCNSNVCAMMWFPQHAWTETCSTNNSAIKLGLPGINKFMVQSATVSHLDRERYGKEMVKSTDLPKYIDLKAISLHAFD